MMDTFLKNVRCLGPRLSAKYGSKPKSTSHSYVKRDTYESYHVQEECGTVEDCFDNHYLPCPRYGWTVRITYEVPCGYYGCPEDPPSYGPTERQLNEGFASKAPPECRTTYRY